MSDEEIAAGGAGAAADEEKHHGHYGWASETQKRRAELAALGVPTGPTKLSDGDALPASAPTLVTGGSAWNAAGTFEERDVSVRARAILSEIALARTIKLGGAGATAGLHARVTAVDKCDGQVHVIFARGKTRPGYELNIALALEVHSEASAAAGLPAVSTGSATFEEVSDSEGSDFFGSWGVDVSAHDDAAAGGVSRDALRKLVRDRVGDFRDIFKVWVEAVKKL